MPEVLPETVVIDEIPFERIEIVEVIEKEPVWDSQIAWSVFLDDEDDDLYVDDLWLEWITVNLTSSNWEKIATTITKNDGSYFFGELQPGEYCVQYENSTIYEKDSSIAWYEQANWTESLVIKEDTTCITITETGEFSVKNDFWLVYIPNEEVHESSEIQPLLLPVALPNTGAQIK